MRGRKPKPTVLKLLEGNPGKRPLPHEPKPERIAPSCPRWMPLEAKRKWRELAPRLEPIGLLTELDGPAFAGFCCAYARWRAAEETVEREGLTITGPDGRVKAHPCARISTQASGMMLKFAQDFGLTPSSRSRIHIPAPVNKQTLRDKLGFPDKRTEEDFFGEDPA